MPFLRVLRPVLALGVLVLGGCVAAPPPLAPGEVYASQQCAAGFYTCVLPAPGPVGTPCSCPGLGAPSYGVIR